MPLYVYEPINFVVVFSLLEEFNQKDLSPHAKVRGSGSIKSLHGSEIQKYHLHSKYSAAYSFISCLKIERETTGMQQNSLHGQGVSVTMTMDLIIDRIMDSKKSCVARRWHHVDIYSSWLH